MTIIDESLTAKGFTPAAKVRAAFGVPRTIDGILIHHWGVRGQSHDGVVNFFVNGPGHTSAHYVVSDGRIHCLVSPEDAAWHCPGKNQSTIGIECRPEATDGDYATVAELIRTLRAQYGPLPLSRHRDWYNTACPGVWDLDRLDAMASSGGITTHGATSYESQEDDELSKSAELDIARIREILEAGEVAGTRASISAIDERTALLVKDIAYVKGSDDPTLFERLEGNVLRPISLTEWQATGKPYVTYPQAKFNEIFKRV